jgi:hypothetical protein
MCFSEAFGSEKKGCPMQYGGEAAQKTWFLFVNVTSKIGKLSKRLNTNELQTCRSYCKYCEKQQFCTHRDTPFQEWCGR